MKIEVTLDELNIILSGLGELPAKISFSLIGNLHKQAQEIMENEKKKGQEIPSSMEK